MKYNVEIFDVLDSTNKYFEEMDTSSVAEGSVVCAKSQRCGVGQQGNMWESEEGKNLTFSILLKPTFLPISDRYMLTKVVSLAMIDFLNKEIPGEPISIKWPNDIYVNGKKICGMLIENTLVGEYLDYSIIGIGLNVNNALEEELAPIATTINKITGKEANRESVLFTLIYNLQNPEKVSLYDDYLLFLGQKISVISRDGTTFTDIIDGVLEDGRLLLKSGKILTAEEISIRDVN